MKKRDKVVLAVVFFVLTGLCLWKYVLTGQQGEVVVVQVSGETWGVYSLQEDREISILDGENILVIQNGEVWMQSASCHNQVCVHHVAIQEAGETIVCLPHQVVVEILEGDGQ